MARRFVRTVKRLSLVLTPGRVARTFILMAEDGSWGSQGGIGELLTLAGWEHARATNGLADSKIRERFGRGDLCFVHRLEGRIVCRAWVSTGEMDALWTKMNLASGESYVYDVYTDPDHRRRRIASGVIATALSHLKRLGVHRAYVAVDDDNAASLRMFEAMGFARIGEILVRPWLNVDQLGRIARNRRLTFRLLGCRGYSDESAAVMQRMFPDLPLLAAEPRGK